MTDYLAALLMTYMAFLLAILSPGPNILGVLNTSLEQGRAAGVQMGVGIALGSLTWSTLTVVGLTQYVAQYGVVLQIIKVMGGLYLIFLAYQALKSSMHEGQRDKGRAEEAQAGSYFLRGYLLMMTNPKAALAWVAIISLATFSSSPAWLPVALIAGTFTISIVVHVLLAMAFSSKPFAEKYWLCRAGILRGFSAVYGGLGVKLLSSVRTTGS